MLDFLVLSDLVKHITLNKIKEVEVLGGLNNEKKRLNRFYLGLSKGKYASDAEAAMDLFGQSDEYPSYRRLRRKLFDQLINTSFFVDAQLAKFNEANRAFYMCNKHLSSSAILLSLGAVQAAIYILRNALEYSIKYELTTITTEILTLLRKAYITNQIYAKDLKKIVRMRNDYEIKRNYEYNASLIFEGLIEGYYSGRVRRSIVDESVKEHFENFLSVADTVDTTKYYYIVYNIGLIYYLSNNNIKEGLVICKKAIETLQKRKNAKKAEILLFAINALFCFTQLKEFKSEEILKVIDLCQTLPADGTVNWAKVNEIIMHHYVYSERYEDALNLYHSVILHERFKTFPPTITEIWKVYAGYFHLLAVLRVIDDELVFKKVGPIDIDRFEMEIKSLSQVKIGMNIPVLMLPVWFKSLEGNMDAHGRSKDSLKQYAHRHLKKSKNVRTVAMLNLLMALDKYAYEPKSAKRLIAKHLKTLTDMPIELSQQSSAIEIVPYEKLWELILRYKRVRL